MVHSLLHQRHAGRERQRDEPTVMKKIPEIEFGFSDAENYRRRENKDLFNRIFLHTDTLSQIEKPSTFFLVGDKGTGKTAYAVYFSNSQHKDNHSIHKFIRETDYQNFVNLKRNNSLSISDYSDIWRVIIYLILSETIYNNSSLIDSILKFPKFAALKAAIDEYYNSAFAPEIATALQFVENTKLAAEILLKHADLTGKGEWSRASQSTTTKSVFQTNLLMIEKNFQEALSSLKLPNNILLFIDGVDIRPSSVPYEEYVDCVKGLANAIWSINNDFFPSIRDSRGRLRVVLLLRPDIFNSLGLQNRNTKLKDNSAILDWRTVYYSHRSSNLFRMADRMFSAQQDEKLQLGVCWDHYFPFNATNVRADESYPTSFILFIRNSFHRPRDILTMLDILGDTHGRTADENTFEYGDLFTSDFRRRYGDYLLGEIKDSLSFYYDEVEFDIFLKFFEYLDGMQKFSYEKYTSAFVEFSNFIHQENKPRPEFMKTADEFLQFLYDQNVICYIEEAEGGERFIRWCFMERTASNISPKIKTGLDYEIHYGLANTLNTGKELKKRNRNVRVNLNANAKVLNPPVRASQLGESENVVGIIKKLHKARRYGFITSDVVPKDIYFRTIDCAEGVKIKVNTKIIFRYHMDDKEKYFATIIEQFNE